MVAAGFLVLWYWAWGVPARALADRQPLGAAFSRTEARRVALKQMKWGQFVWSGLIAVIGGAWLASKGDVLAGWNRLWLIVGALFIGLLCWRMWQKWQADRVSD